MVDTTAYTDFTTREIIATILRESPELRELGLPEGNVFQADTLDSPDSKPFIVVRWGEEETGMGATKVRPFDLWGYDDEGDYTRIERIVVAAGRILSSIDPIKKEGGWLTAIRDQHRGGDLADEGFNAVVIAYHLSAIASGV